MNNGLLNETEKSIKQNALVINAFLPLKRLINMEKDWKGGIIAEGLSDPTVINRFSVCFC
jgi:hypothetical protein